MTGKDRTTGPRRTWIRHLAIGASIAAALAATGRVDAVYNANMRGVVTEYWSYTDIDEIYFILSTQPSSHPVCNPAYFVVPGTVPVDRRKMIFARLAQAYVTGETITVGYDATGACWHNHIQVHRVG